MKTQKRQNKKVNLPPLNKEQQNNPFYLFYQANHLLKQDQASLAINYLIRAGQLGHGGAFGTLGNLYLEGKVVDFDVKEAAEYFKKGIACDSIEAKYLLGTLYANGTGVKKNIKKAVEMITECAELGYGYAYFFFGVAYNFGLYNMKQDFVKARYYYEQATKDNLGQAYHNLALLYAQGDGV
ncbi:MAG: sel1 repeat family protein, partial [Desulfovibrio sp.]|nr:sel1 repeat family protein [Desulfovibrio sp.]